MGIAVSDSHFQIEGNFYPTVPNFIQDFVVFAFPDDEENTLFSKNNYCDTAQDLEVMGE